MVMAASYSNDLTACRAPARAKTGARSVPSPLVGEGQGGVATSTGLAATPLPQPSQQAGREQTESASRPASRPLHPLGVEHRLLPGAVAPERALIAARVGALEDPVLPGGEAREDLGFHRFRAAEAQIGLEPGERIGGEARALLEKHAYLVPVDVIEREGDEPKRGRRLGVEHLAALGLGLVEIRRRGQ